MRTEPSPRVKAMLRAFAQKQREEHGEDWKEKFAAKMAEQTSPVIEKLLELRDRSRAN
ncbi:MAG: hypothetical protein Unbinned2301contig1004_14 [Prokaryotic dsDNA virus sp.]|nr:MAG: hypothetical protein Unbinned2301contig1004_14 [Prokaryotic dsDNA virus sp.]